MSFLGYIVSTMIATLDAMDGFILLVFWHSFTIALTWDVNELLVPNDNYWIIFIPLGTINIYRDSGAKHKTNW